MLRQFIILTIAIGELLLSGDATSSKDQTTEIVCRNELGYHLSTNEFASDACARCYNYMPEHFFIHKLRYVGNGMLLDTRDNSTLSDNQTTSITQTFASVGLAMKWQQCCRDAIQCCKQSLDIISLPSATVKTISQKGSSNCPRTWDGWSCWSEKVKAGEEASQQCPEHIYWEQLIPSCRGYVTKRCDNRGHWFRIEGREWSNYSLCARDDVYVNRLYYSVGTHCITILSIVPALIIFNYYKQLSTVSRIRVHKHFFTSLLLYSTISALLKWNIIKTSSKSLEDTFGTLKCCILSFSLRYFRSTTYVWMFNEALHLHQLVKHPFDQPSLVQLVMLAYGLPLLTTACYGGTRYFLERHKPEESQHFFPFTITTTSHIPSNEVTVGDEDNMDLNLINDRCWLFPCKIGWVEWIIHAPNLIMLIANALFLMALLKILCHKASSTTRRQCDTEDDKTKQSTTVVVARAAALLLPLYGLQYGFIVYRPHITTCWLSQVYHYVSITLDGFQGAVVAIIFCYTNDEVKTLIHKTVHRRGSHKSGTLCLTEIIGTQPC